MGFSPDLQSALENIYISPLELCNLNCRLCYTNKTKNILSNRQILSFIRRYQKYLHTQNLSLKSVLFCGGEVFTLKNFPSLINRLNHLGIFTTIITNGTIDRLSSIKNPNNCQLLVSFDGPESIHDRNRGQGNFQKSAQFVSHALELHFPVEIMYLVTPQSYPHLNTFNLFGLPNNFITQKTSFYTQNHPLARRNVSQDGLTPNQIIHIKKNYPSVPAKNFGCYQLSLQSNGNLYGCCESPHPLGSLHDPLKHTVARFLKSLDPCSRCPLYKKQKSETLSQYSCNGCSDPEFLCGYKQELALTTCQEVVKSFNS